MLLSIGMIVKNEEKYLEQCLTALKPILEQVDSELIIADTGSTDRTVEIARQFTDNVFHFEWINDFAAARNSTLERAKGEWYMFIDADEIARDCSGIIKFFKSGEYKRYNFAAYTIRSYVDLSRRENFMEIKLNRLAARRNGLKFINPIHEALFPLLHPYKIIDFTVDHYGYISANDGVYDENNKNKAERNLKILLEEFEKQEASGNVTNKMLCSQIFDSYAGLGESEKALEYLRKGMELIDPNDIIIINYYGKLLKMLFLMRRYGEVLEICEKYFSKENAVRTETLLQDCYVYYYRASSNFFLENDKGIVRDLKAFFDLYDRYVNNRLTARDVMVTEFNIRNDMIERSFAILYKSSVDKDRYGEAAEGIRKFPIAACLSDSTFVDLYISQYIEIMEHTNFAPLPDLYGKLDSINKQRLVNTMLWYIFESDKPEQISNELKRVIRHDKRLNDTVRIYDRYFVKKDLTPDAVNEFISEHGGQGNENILCVMLLAGFDITPFITIGYLDLKKSVQEIYQQYTNSVQLFAEYDIRAVSREGLEKAAEVYAHSIEAAHTKATDIAPLFEKFTGLGEKWLESNPGDLYPTEYINVAILANNAILAQNSGDLSRRDELLDSLTKILPVSAQILSEHIAALNENSAQTVKFKLDIQSLISPNASSVMEPSSGKLEVKDTAAQSSRFKVNSNAINRLKNLSAPEQSAETLKQPAVQKNAPLKPKTEFELLAEQFKQNIRAMIDAGNIEDAQSLISQYEQLRPDDPEIIEIKKNL